jgi:hypothetical protein
MPRARNNENRGYPKSWRFRYDAYYCRVPKGQEQLAPRDSSFFLLQKSENEDLLLIEWGKF